MDDSLKYSEICGSYYNEQYAKARSYWGEQPNLLVPLVSSHLKPHSRVLVIGCGEGRDALFLARLGFEVVATDIAENGLQRLRESIKGADLNLQVHNFDAHLPHDHLGEFQAMLLMNVLQFLQPEKIGQRLAHFQSLVKPGGFMSIQVFTTEDPEYQQQLREGSISTADLVAEHSVRKYKIRFFQKGELASYYRGWEFIYYHEGLMWDKPHGIHGDFHQHGLAQMIAKKKIFDEII